MPLRATTLADYQRRLLNAQRLLETRLDEPVDPAALAEAAHFSLHHFHRIFRAQMGETVMQHIRRLRLERAARKLRLRDERILDLAFEAGYESHEAFTRAFVELFGTPPSQFRDTTPPRVAAMPEPSAEPTVPIRVEAYPAVRVAFMRSRGSYAVVGALWSRLLAWAAPRGLLTGQPVMYGLCPDDPDVTAAEFLRFDACVAVDATFTDPEAGITEVPAGTYAVGLHVGPYDRLHETYLDIIGRWFPRSGYEPAPDAVVEHYLNDPSCAAPHDLRTEVRVRVAD